MDTKETDSIGNTKTEKTEETAHSDEASRSYNEAPQDRKESELHKEDDSALVECKLKLEDTIQHIEQINAYEISILERFDVDGYIQMNAADMKNVQNSDVLELYKEIEEDLVRLKSFRVSEIKAKKTELEQKYKEAQSSTERKERGEALVQFYAKYQRELGRKKESSVILICNCFDSIMRRVIEIEKRVGALENTSDTDVINLRRNVQKYIDPRNSKYKNWVYGKDENDRESRMQRIHNRAEKYSHRLCKVSAKVIPILHCMYLMLPEEYNVVQKAVERIVETPQYTYMGIGVLVVVMYSFLSFIFAIDHIKIQNKKYVSVLYKPRSMKYTPITEKSGSTGAVSVLVRVLDGIMSAVKWSIWAVLYVLNIVVLAGWYLYVFTLPLIVLVCVVCVFYIKGEMKNALLYLFYMCAIFAYVGNIVNHFLSFCFDSAVIEETEENENSKETHTVKRIRKITSTGEDVWNVAMILVMAVLLLCIIDDTEKVFTGYMKMVNDTVLSVLH